jgi:hypothetical protein
LPLLDVFVFGAARRAEVRDDLADALRRPLAAALLLLVFFGFDF